MSFVTAAYRPLWRKKAGTITGSSSGVIDTFSAASFTHADYILTITNLANTLTKSLKISVNKADGDVTDLVYAKFGDSINIAVSSALNAGQFELTMDNNEAFDLVWALTRIKIRG